MRSGKAVLMVEQNVRFGLRMASSGIVMESGRVLLTGPAQSVLANPEIADLYFGGAVHAPCHVRQPSHPTHGLKEKEPHMSASNSLKIGWIGAGRMGAQLVTRLLDAGYDVTVYNRTASKAAHLAEKGATIVSSPVDLADRDLVFSWCPSSKDLEQVMLGEGGLLTGTASPRIIADSSTVSAEASARIREAANSRGCDFLATPVSGNPKVIAAGKLTVAVSGPREVFDSIEPVLNVFGRSVTYVGEGEVARLVKIAHNLMLGVVTQCLAEITVLVEKGGVSRADFLAFLNDSVMGSVFTQYKSPAFVNLDFTPDVHDGAAAEGLRPRAGSRRCSSSRRCRSRRPPGRSSRRPRVRAGVSTRTSRRCCSRWPVARASS